MRPGLVVIKETMRFFAAVACVLVFPVVLSAQAPSPKPDAPIPTISVKTAGMQNIPGLLPLHWDAKGGKLYLEIPHLDMDLLYTHSLPYGSGSNDLGLDRVQISEGQVVRFGSTVH